MRETNGLKHKRKTSARGPHGLRPAELPAAGGYHGGDRQQGAKKGVSKRPGGRLRLLGRRESPNQKDGGSGTMLIPGVEVMTHLGFDT